MVDQKLEERLERIETLLKNPNSNPGPQLAKVCTRQVTFSETLAALQGVTMEEPCPLTGEIIEVTMAFPDGCNGLVELQFGHGGLAVLPSKKEEFIALNNSTPTFRNLRESVTKGERLWTILRNGDAVNPHKPSIIVVINGVE